MRAVRRNFDVRIERVSDDQVRYRALTQLGRDTFAAMKAEYDVMSSLTGLDPLSGFLAAPDLTTPMPPFEATIERMRQEDAWVDPHEFAAAVEGAPSGDAPSEDVDVFRTELDYGRVRFTPVSERAKDRPDILVEVVDYPAGSFGANRGWKRVRIKPKTTEGRRVIDFLGYRLRSEDGCAYGSSTLLRVGNLVEDIREVNPDIQLDVWVVDGVEAIHTSEPEQVA